MLIKIIRYVLPIFFFLQTYIAYSEEYKIRPTIVIFPILSENVQVDAVTVESAKEITAVINNLGILFPAELNKINNALTEANASGTDDVYKKAAEFLEVDIYITVMCYKRGNNTFGDARIFQLNGRYGKVSKNILVKSSIAVNVPLKLAREIAYLHEKLNLSGDVLKNEAGTGLISLGQRNNISTGSYQTTEGKTLIVIEADRYTSKVKLPDGFSDKTVTLEKQSNYNKEIRRLDNILDANLIYKSGLKNTFLKGEDPEKRLVTAVAFINPLTTTIIPVYGAYLSAGYLGFDGQSTNSSHEPSGIGLAYTGVVLLTQILLPEIVAGFTVNYWPWIEGGAKTAAMQNFQIFMFATIPLTGTAAFLDQLAYLFNKSDKIIPFFDNRDWTAMMFSIFIPGGGLFYKGWRIFGWSYFTSEMVLAGFGFYYLGNTEYSGYFFLAYAVLKLGEILHAYFINPGYNYYNNEMSREVKRSDISFNIRERKIDRNDAEVFYSISAVLKF